MPTLRVNGYGMAFAERGAGAPLLLVHGTLCDYRHWTEHRGALPDDRLEPPALLARAMERRGRRFHRAAAHGRRGGLHLGARSRAGPSAWSFAGRAYRLPRSAIFS